MANEKEKKVQKWIDNNSISSIRRSQKKEMIENEIVFKKVEIGGKMFRMTIFRVKNKEDYRL